MDKLVVSTEELRKAALSIDDLAAQYEAEYNALVEDVRTLAATDYNSDDGRAFCARVEGFKDDFEKMKVLMKQYADFLRIAATTYEDNTGNLINIVNTLPQ